MYIMSQNKTSLINPVYVSRYYIDETPEGTRVMAVVDDEPVILGVYKELKRAKNVLEFIGVSLNDEEAASKTTQIPTEEYVDEYDKRFEEIAKIVENEDGLLDALKELVENS